ncbi:hypothetical protein C8F01DRAFT_1370007 [Mycena amicta]|nr:hypothetical protein C8F01DRAFT_1370007 [Mycena amicta]
MVLFLVPLAILGLVQVQVNTEDTLNVSTDLPNDLPWEADSMWLTPSAPPQRLRCSGSSPVSFANLLGLTLGGLIHGVYLVLFISSMYLSSNSTGGAGSGSRKSSFTGRILSALKSPIVVASFALFMSATATFILNVYRSFQGWILVQGGANHEQFFIEPATTAGTVLELFGAISLVVGDAMFIYCLWVVWRNRWLLVPGLITFVGLIISLVITIVQTLHLRINGTVRSGSIGLTPMTVFALSTTFYCTALISYKLYKVGSAVSGLVGEKGLTHIAAIFVESAAAYTSWFILYGILYGILHWLNNNLQLSIFYTLPSMIGAANALITARVALRRGVDTSRWNDANSTLNVRSGASATIPVHLPIRFARRPSDTGTVPGTRTTDVEAQGYAMESVSKGEA